MPKVLQYSGQQVTTQVARTPTLRTPQVADTASIIGPALGRLAGAVGQVQNNIDETDAESALVQFERDKNDLFFNADSGYFSTSGKNAYDGREPTSKSLDELQKKYSESLTSTGAREMFKRSSDVHVTRGRTTINKHAADGFRAYENATIAARVENSIESAALNFNSDDEMALQRQVGRQAVIDKADRDGLDGEAKNEMLQSYDSKFVAAAINAAAQQDIGRANELYGRLGDRLEGNDALVIADNMKKLNFDVDSQTATADIIADGSRSLSDMVNDVNAMEINTPEDAKIKTEVMRQVKNQYNLNKTIREEQEREVYEDYGKQIQDGLGQFTTTDIPGTAWNGMTLAQRSSLRKLEKTLAAGDNVVTNDVLLSDLLLLPKTELAKQDPVWFFDQIGGADRDKLVRAVSAARAGKDDAQYTAARSKANVINQSMEQIFGRKSSKYSSSQLETANSLHRMINTEVQYREDTLQRKLTPVEFEDLMHGFTRTTIQEGLIFDSELDITDVPEEFYSEISKELRRRGHPVTAGNIIKFYAQGQSSGVFE